MSTHTPIASQTLGSATSSVSFTSIPQGYTDLVVVIGYKAATTNYPTLRLSFNGSATGYSGTQLYGDGATAGSNRTSNAAYISIARAYGVPQTIGNTGTIIIHLQNYSNTTTYKTVLARANASDTGTEADVGLWQNTSAITSFSIDAPTSNDFASGSTFTLHGIAVGNSSAKADGGSTVTTDGSYWYHTFKSSGAFIPRQALTADVLVIAGGGGGGAGHAGGGGAGGYRAFTSQSLTSKTSYIVTVGAGGSGALQGGSTKGISGNNSSFGSNSSTGGGGGGSRYDANGGSGGSGGGAGYYGAAGSGNAGGYSPVEGYAGGGGGGANTAGSGGGGAGGAGTTDTNGENGEVGGPGSNAHSSWASATGTGVSGYYAGGGGGGAYTPAGDYYNGAGGSGGGGGGGQATEGNAAVKNTGSGGGGGAVVSVQKAGGAGGSGLVIIRYAV